MLGLGLWGGVGVFERQLNNVKQPVLEAFRAGFEETLRGAPLFWIGFSSGSKLPIEAQGKFDARRERGEAAPPLDGTKRGENELRRL